MPRLNRYAELYLKLPALSTAASRMEAEREALERLLRGQPVFAVTALAICALDTMVVWKAIHLA